MKSIKPGRGPSALNVWGSVIAVVFGIFWTLGAAGMGAPGIFPAFGILFILTGIINGIYHFFNATGKNRYSAYDITEDGEEPDPLSARFGEKPFESPDPAGESDTGASDGFCPYCGAPVKRGYAYCSRCGKKLPEN